MHFKILEIHFLEEISVKIFENRNRISGRNRFLRPLSRRAMLTFLLQVFLSALPPPAICLHCHIVTKTVSATGPSLLNEV